MKKYYSLITIFAIAAITLTSCSKWLEVQPEDKFTEEQIFTSPDGVATALNGIYLDISQNKLYGSTLTSTTLDIFAQYYNVGSSHNLESYGAYDYEDGGVRNKLDAIWTNMYVDIININKFLENLNTYRGVLTPKVDSLFRGEATGLRAYLTFDLLRMFGPIYATDSTNAAIPYYSKASKNVSDILPANQVMDSIVADLQSAEKWLQADPIISQGIINTATKDYLTYRNYRMNYFALKGLEARVYLYRGDKASALTAAKTVIDNSSKFPWITADNILSDKSNPDRVFSTEILFGIQNLDLYSDVYKNNFAPELRDWEILAPLDNRLRNIYENNEHDYRYNPNWVLSGIGGKSYKTFFKYADIENTSKIYRNTVSLIRLSEMYYIAAECEPDQNIAFGYLNIVLNHRGLASLAPGANLSTEIKKEYQKEFWGEGQLWFYYKRTNANRIPKGYATSGNVSMSAAQYVFPLPLSETTPR